MSIKTEANHQLARLIRSGFRPTPLPADKPEYLRALEAGYSEAEVTECGDRLVKGEPLDDDGRARAFFPNTGEIAAVYALIRAKSRHAKEWTGMDAETCPHCLGSGMRPTAVKMVDGVEYSFAKVCECRKVTA